MRTTLILIAGLLLPAATTHAQALKLVGTPTRNSVATGLPVQSGEAVVMEMLLMAGTDMTTIGADLLQIAGTIAAPLDIPVTITPSPRGGGLALVTFNAPTVNRVTRLHLRLTDESRWPLIVFPVDKELKTQPDLAALLKSTRRQLLVCGRYEELRDFLNARSIPFEDLGIDAPKRLRAEEVLLGEVTSEDWSRLTGPDVKARLIVALDDPSLLPGVYTTITAAGPVTKITLPLFHLLPDNPQARATLHQLLLYALTPDSN